MSIEVGGNGEVGASAKGFLEEVILETYEVKRGQEVKRPRN